MVKNDWGKKPKWQLRDFVPGLKKWKAALSTTFSEYMDTAETPKSLEKIKDRQKVQKKLSEELDIMEKLAYAIEVGVIVQAPRGVQVLVTWVAIFIYYL
jgi:hypothetical protein